MNPARFLTLALALPFLVGACGGGFTDDDTTANTVGARTESAQYAACSGDGGASCSAPYMRASSALAYCANARELAAHGKPVPAAPAGLTCPHP